MTTSNDAVTARPLGPAIGEHRRLLLAEGIVLAVVGSAAILVPVLARAAIAIQERNGAQGRHAIACSSN